MKTQKIVLALALVAVTPAVLSAQDYVGGPGSKMSYIADNALARIRQNHKESNPQDQNPVKNQQTVEPQQQTVQQAKTVDTTPAYYPYAGREGHMMALENLGRRRNNSSQTKTTPRNNNTVSTNRATNTYNPYVGPEGHRAALGNAVRDARDTTPTVPNHVRDIDTVARNHQATLNNKTADRSAKKTNRTFRYYLNEVGHAIAQEAPYMK